MKIIPAFFICILSNLSFGQFTRPLAYELERCDIETALIWSSTGIDEYPIWSPDSKEIAINIMGRWIKINLDEVILIQADWLDQTIGQNTSEIIESISESDITKFKDTTTYGPRKVTTKDGMTLELKMLGMRTAFLIDEKMIWITSGGNCHSLALSPDGNYVAFISEMNGLMVYSLDNKLLKKQLPKHVLKSNIAINQLIEGKTEKAEKYWDQLIESNKKFSEPFFWKAAMALANENDSLAIDYLDKAIAIDPAMSTYYFFKAMIYQHMGENDHAIEHFEAYINLKPTDLYGYYYLADLYKSMSDRANACKYFKLAKKYHSNRAQEFIDELCE